MRKTAALPALCLAAALLGGCAGDPTLSAAAMQATFDDGLKDYDSGNYEAAFKKWSSIDDVDLAAMRNVGTMLRTGKGVQKDPKAGLAMLQRAAEAGLFTAQADLGDMLFKGEAGSPDPKAAAPWLAMAARAGHPTAQYELGQLYEQGLGIPKDIEAARALYQAAAAGGVAEAAGRLAALPPEPSPAPGH
jgi:uncharacterized protein